MERTRRAFDRSLPKEPGPKRSRLLDESAAPDRFSNGRAGFVQRPAVSNPGGGVSRAQKDRDSESSDSVRGPYHAQPGQPLYQELVSQYKTALAELTFNSKPIITNLTIIAGENLHAAKAIAGTVCANIIEVPSDQKLPSLYLLDSIVKNIGRDYIKYFASKLPEVFCKAYRQVDPSVHPGMRHLFGTWKGVFPAHALQMIEKELGFTPTSNGSSSGVTSRPEPQAQRPAHSIHVNPKYLEARQRLQSTRVGGAGSDTSGGPVNSLEDVEPLGRTMSVSSGRSWADPYAKSVLHNPRDHTNDLIRDRSAAYTDAEYGSSDVLPHKKNGFGLKHGFESFAAHESTNLDTDIQIKQNISNRSSNWKNSEEEEYMWDEMNSLPTVRGAIDAPSKDHWANDNDYRLDFESHLSKPQNVNDIRSRDYDEALADSISMDLRPVGSGTRGPWSDKLHQPGSMLLGTGKNISGYSEAYPSGLKSSQSTVGRTPQSQLGAAHLGSQGFKSSTNVMPGPKVSGTEHRQVLEAPPSSIQARMHQRSPSPLSHNLSKLRGSNSVERGQTSIGPKDPRKTLGHKSTGYIDQFSENSLPLASQEAYQASTQRLKPQALRSMPAPVSSAQHRKHAPSVQPKNLKVSEIESSGLGQKLAVSQISGSESRSGNSSSDQSNPLTVDHPGQSFTSSSVDAALKSVNSLTSRLTKPSSQEAVPESSAVHTASNPVSSLISSLVAKGLISASKSESQLSALPEVPDLPPARDSEIATCSTTPISPVPAMRSKPLVNVRNEPSSKKPSAKDSDSLPASTKDSDSLPASMKDSDSLPASTKDSDNLPASTSNFEPRIGFEFKPGVIRHFHPDVISDLSDFPHRCSICGLGLKLQDQIDRHMQWHELQGSEHNPPSSKTSRSWYVDSADWVDGIDHNRDDSDMLGSSSDMLDSEQMVPADESQCACVLCGELFEDFYSRERNEWMFKGAVYLNSPSSESHEGIGATSDTGLWGPIVHANCISEGSLHSLGMAPDVKLEKDV